MDDHVDQMEPKHVGLAALRVLVGDVVVERQRERYRVSQVRPEGVGGRLSPQGAREPTVVLVGVAGVAYVIPKLGVALGTFTLVFGQLIVAMLIDTFGLLGYEKVPFTPIRVVGVLLMVAGIYFILPKTNS